MLEDAKGAARHPTGHEFEHQRMAHDAAVAAARDGECTPEGVLEPPRHHSYRYEVTDSWAIESSLDFAELRMEILE